MKLAFTNPRSVPAQDFESEEARQQPWLDPNMFTDPRIKKQLFAIAEGWLGSDLTDDRVFSANYDDFDGGSEIPIEFWDVTDEQGKVLYQLWLFDCNSGSLFEDGTDKLVAPVIDNYFRSDNAFLVEELGNAWKEVKKNHPDSRLARFGDPFRI